MVTNAHKLISQRILDRFLETRKTTTPLVCVIYLFTAFAKLIDLPTKVGSAVHFHLPPFTECGYYNLTDSEQTLVLTVFNQSKPTTSDTYRRRSTVESLRNGTILFTLHFISWQDEGLFTMQTPITRCQWNYSLRLIKEGKFRVGDEGNGGGWSLKRT